MKTPKDTTTITAGTNPRAVTTKKEHAPVVEFGPARPRENDLFYKIEELCEKLGCSDRYILNNVRTGGLKANKVGNRYIFLHSNVVAWIQTL